MFLGRLSSRHSLLLSLLEHDRTRLLRVTPSFLTPSCSKGGKHQVTYKPYQAPAYKDHDYKNMGLKRPMSPHLTVYAPTVPAMTSIAQRATGTMITAYALLMAFGTLFMSNGIESYVCIIQSLNLGFFSTFIIKILIGFPFCYHYFNGVRFVGFNAGKGLLIKEVYDSSKKAGIASVIVTVLFALL